MELNMAKKKQVEITIKVPDAKHMEYFTSALSIANAYRLNQGESIMSLERFALNSIITGSNSIMEFYAEQRRKQEEAANAQEGKVDAPEASEQEPETIVEGNQD